MALARTFERLARAASHKLAFHRLDSLRKARDEAAGPFADALGAALTDRATSDEAAFFARVEALRAREAASDEDLEFIDYGAGSRREQYTPEQAARGVPSTRAVASCSRAAKPAFWCRLLFHLVRETKPTRCVELGTSLGISASYTAGALQLEGAGTLVTLEGAPAVAERAAVSYTHLTLPTIQL